MQSTDACIVQLLSSLTFVYATRSGFILMVIEIAPIFRYREPRTLESLLNDARARVYLSCESFFATRTNRLHEHFQ